MVRGSRWRAYALLAGVFLLGALSGAGISYAHYQKTLALLVSEDHGEARDLRRLNAFTKELELSDSQRERVQQIVERHRPERERHARRMFEDCGEPLARVKKAMDSEIRTLLDAEQQRRFDAMQARREKLFKGNR